MQPRRRRQGQGRLRAQLPDPAGQGAPRHRNGDQGVRGAPRRTREGAGRRLSAAQAVGEKLSGQDDQHQRPRPASTAACSARSPTSTLPKRWPSRGSRRQKAQVRMPQGSAEGGRRPQGHRRAAFRRVDEISRSRSSASSRLTPHSRETRKARRGGRIPHDGAARGGFRPLLCNSRFLAGIRPQRTDGIRRAP